MIRFLKVDLDLIEDENLTANELRVYLYLLTKYNTEKKCAYPSLETISEKINMSLSTVKRAIKKLEELEYVTVEKRKGLSGNFNIYKDMKHLIDNITKNKEVNTEENINQEIITIEKSAGEDIVPIETTENKINNHQNVRLARSVTNIDNSKFAKTVLTMCDEEIVRESIRSFKTKKGKSATFLIQLVVDEYFKAKVNFSNKLLNLLKSGLRNPYLTQPI